MTARATKRIVAASDEDDCLVSADEALGRLQMQCGGTLPGKIAIPELLEVVRKARNNRVKMARGIVAQDDGHQIHAWVQVEPKPEGGCDIEITDWRTAALPPEDQRGVERFSAELDGVTAELVAWLDTDQRLLAVEGEAPDVRALVREMRGGTGRRWTDFVEVGSNGQRQLLHWRLLDGAAVSVPGSTRSWRVRLRPHEPAGAEPAGFELLLTAREPAPIDEPTTPASPQAARRGLNGAIGRDIGPVLRQPVSRIIANAETIRTRLAGPLADEYAGYAADIAAAGQHLLALLNDLGDLEVVEADDFRTEPDLIDLAEVARQAAGILGVRAREKGIAVEAPDQQEALSAIAEFRRVLQVLLNLIGNAIRYSPPNSTIRIELGRGDGRVWVSVADEGPGLSNDDQARVFAKFERLGRSGDGGSGLGLYISRRLARAMGGELSVTSVPGEGARFTLTLPSAD